MTNHLFTVVCEFDGGTYVSQVRAGDERQAFTVWGDLLRNSRPMSDDADRIADMALDDADPLTPLDGLAGAWCWARDLEGRLVLANIIRSG